MKTRTMKNVTAAVIALGLLATASLPARADAELAKKLNCTSCHAIDKKMIGPAYQDVAKKYKGQPDATAKLVEKVKKGSQGVWGPVPMPPNTNVSDGDAKTLVDWVLAQAK